MEVSYSIEDFPHKHSTYEKEHSPEALKFKEEVGRFVKLLVKLYLLVKRLSISFKLFVNLSVCCVVFK